MHHATVQQTLLVIFCQKLNLVVIGDDEWFFWNSSILNSTNHYYSCWIQKDHAMIVDNYRKGGTYQIPSTFCQDFCFRKWTIRSKSSSNINIFMFVIEWRRCDCSIHCVICHLWTKFPYSISSIGITVSDVVKVNVIMDNTVLFTQSQTCVYIHLWTMTTCQQQPAWIPNPAKTSTTLYTKLCSMTTFWTINGLWG